uniref:Uncharacterized protein n=1 Tax=Lepeophtheirus salmonis TaxID=72036 RepID=A0A0K2U454_LEPSM
MLRKEPTRVKSSPFRKVIQNFGIALLTSFGVGIGFAVYDVNYRRYLEEKHHSLFNLIQYFIPKEDQGNTGLELSHKKDAEIVLKATKFVSTKGP